MTTQHTQKIFSQIGTFVAKGAAEDWLRINGFHYGSWQRGAPCGVMFDKKCIHDISKWRNMRPSERTMLHGVLEGDGREGPLTLTLRPHAPAEAFAAIAKAEGK